ncbi:MAG: FHA domain-containing protein [Anaerolineaceae bacterium]|nr:FHA domain-containing protein [Anaerolineaceae bacterium]
MRICPICAHSNREGVVICERCGSHITHIPSLPTRQLEIASIEGGELSRRGTAHLRPNTRVVISIRDTEEQLVLKTIDRVVLGRLNKNISRKPDIDLTPYGAYRKGVSSTHAILKREDNTLIIQDMGSTNGTFLNGQQLFPNQPYVLRDGDEIRLGHLVARFRYQRA